MRGAAAWKTALRAGGRAAGRTGVAGAIAATVALGSATAAQARPGPGAHGPADDGDSTAFVHQIRWSSSSPARGVTLLSGVYSTRTRAVLDGDDPGTPRVRSAPAPKRPKRAAWLGQRTEASLTADGFDPSATVLPWPRYADDPARGDGRAGPRR